MAEVAAQVGAEGGVEAEAADRRPDGGLLLLGAKVDPGEDRRGLDRGLLGEVDEVDGGEAPGHELSEGLVQRRLAVLVLEEDGPLTTLDKDGRAAGAALEVVLEAADRAERGRHQQELG